jgi:hypothetical protein
VKIKAFRFTGKYPNFEVHSIVTDDNNDEQDIELGDLEYVGTLNEKQLKELIQETLEGRQQPKLTNAMQQLTGKAL